MRKQLLKISLLGMMTFAMYTMLHTTLLFAETIEKSAEGSVSAGDAKPLSERVGSVSANEAPLGRGVSVSGGDAALLSLQMPQKLNLVIDPYEINERGQIYAESYTLRNVGSSAGILSLTGRITLQSEKELTIATDTQSIHEGDDNAIYLKMIFSNGEELLFTNEDTVCEIFLSPGEEIGFTFGGEVNENAKNRWKGEELDVEIVYDWTTRPVI